MDAVEKIIRKLAYNPLLLTNVCPLLQLKLISPFSPSPQSMHCRKITLAFYRSIRECTCFFNRTNSLGNLSSSHFIIAFANVSGRSLEATNSHLHCQSRSCWSTTSLFMKSSSYSSKIDKMSTFSLNFSEHKTDGFKINNSAALNWTY